LSVFICESKQGGIFGQFPKITRFAHFLSKAVPNTALTAGIPPFHGAVNAGNHAGAAFEAAGIFHNHLPLFVQGIEVGRAGIDTETFLAGITDVLVEEDMGFFVVFKGI
jgi:hypothetical protein